MKNNKGFAISGILYGILILFLFLLLLILGNLQARKVLFDKQKAEILDKIDKIGAPDLVAGSVVTFEEDSEYTIPKDGNYRLIACNSSGCKYKDAYFFQGLKLYISVGDNSFVRLEKYGSVFLSDSSGSSYTESLCNSKQVCLVYQS